MDLMAVGFSLLLGQGLPESQHRTRQMDSAPTLRTQHHLLCGDAFGVLANHDRHITAAITDSSILPRRDGGCAAVVCFLVLRWSFNDPLVVLRVSARSRLLRGIIADFSIHRYQLVTHNLGRERKIKTVLDEHSAPKVVVIMASWHCLCPTHPELTV